MMSFDIVDRLGGDGAVGFVIGVRVGGLDKSRKILRDRVVSASRSMAGLCRGTWCRLAVG